MSDGPTTLAYIAAGAATASATAAAISARANLSAVRRAHLPFVYGEPAEGKAGQVFRNQEDYENAPVVNIFVQVYNDGPGTAVDVRVWLVSSSGEWASGQDVEPIRALRPGTSVGPFRFRPPWDEDENIQSWGIATRFQDTSGRTWESFNQRYPSGELTRKRVDRWRSMAQRGAQRLRP